MPPARRHVGLATISSTFSPYLKKDQQILQNPPKPKATKPAKTQNPLKPKKRKTPWACNHCQKAHLTCDEGRPCQRCIRKGCQDTCRDGARKPAKYLMDTQSTQQPPASTNNNQLWSLQNHSSSYSSMVLPNMIPSPPDNTQFNSNFHIPLPPSPPNAFKSASTPTPFSLNLDCGTNNESQSTNSLQFDFSSRAADYEYSSISNLLADAANDFALPIFNNQTFHLPFEDSFSSNSLHHHRSDSTSSSSSSARKDDNTPSTVDTPPTSDYSPASTFSSSTTETPCYSHSFPPLQPQQQQQQAQPHNRHFSMSSQTQTHFPTTQQPHQDDQLQLHLLHQPQTKTQSQKRHASSSPSSAPLAASITMVPGLYSSPEEVYSKITKPFSYTEGYHDLINYLRNRFDRPQLVSLAKSMAAYRPSFIATTKTLQEEDLVFMEKCFQRTLLEFEKFIASSGTPTVVWRRTGQIAAAGREFCLLTGWQHSDLVVHEQESRQSPNGKDSEKPRKPRFIVELMDDTSVAKYFDLFTQLAFGDSRGVIMTDCSLLKPNGDTVRTACTWTVKRDVFDIPMMIVGNFLPILD